MGQLGQRGERRSAVERRQPGASDQVEVHLRGKAEQGVEVVAGTAGLAFQVVDLLVRALNRGQVGADLSDGEVSRRKRCLRPVCALLKQLLLHVEQFDQLLLGGGLDE